ncbi:MAG: methyltransferase domain-containing protein, partial [Microbacterium sp.]
CGPAAVSVELARIVGPTGRVIGVEREDAARTAARQVIAEAGVTNVELREGSATSTGIAPGTVDLAMMRHVLAHNGGSEQAIVDHLASLVRPGGAVYLVDVDLTGIRILDSDPDLDDLTERYAGFHAARGNDPTVGLRLSSLLTAAGLETVDFTGHYSIIEMPPGVRPPVWAARDTMVAEGAATPADVERWGAAFDRIDASPVRPTAFAPVFIAIGRKGD